MFRMSFVGMILAVSLTGCLPDIFSTQPEVKGIVTEQGVRTLSEPAQSSLVELAPGNTVFVRLRGNPTTGYVWTPANQWNEAVLELVGETYESDSNPQEMTGVGGVFVFEFKALKPGKVTVEMGYARSGTAPAETKTITVNILD